jgi:hypothetical protein
VSFEPWIKYPPLTKERLLIVAGLMRQVRSDTADLHDPGVGDNGWSLGCRAYARTCYRLRQAVADYPWLTIVKEEQYHQFTFAIGSVPIRFYHGGAATTPGKYLSVTFGELRQQQLALDLGVPIDEVLRIAIETDSAGKPTIVTLIEMGKDDSPLESYVIPSDEGKVVPFQQKGIDLPRPRIELLNVQNQTTKRKKERDAG